jgi:hypothetical protein
LIGDSECQVLPHALILRIAYYMRHIGLPFSNTL